MLDDELVAFLARVSLGYLATRNAEMVPQGHRPLGHSVGPDRKTIRLFFQTKYLRNLEQGLADNRAGSVCLSDPLNFESYQLKGTIESVEDVTDEDLATYEAYRKGLSEAVAQIGLPAGPFGPYLAAPPTRAVVLRIEEVFHQTPGPGAGARREAK
jgi:hypothetical protein